MFGLRRAPDQFQLVLGFSHDRARGSGGEGAASGGRKVSVEWTSVEGEAVVLERLERALSDPSLVQEHVHVRLGAPGAGPGTGVVAAAAFRHEVHLGLEVHSTKPTLGSVELLRTSGSGALPPALAAALWSALELSYVRRVRCTDGAAQLLEFDALSRLASLRVLNLSHCGMASLPAGVGQIESLEELRLVGNRLKMLPKELGRLRSLRTLAADSNEIVILPGELRNCSALEELTLENNRLTSVLLDFRSLPRLQVLHLYNNPLEFLPEISPCHALRHLSVANMRVTADPGLSKFKVELLPPSAAGGGGGGMSLSLFDSGKQQDRLRPIFALMLRRSSGHHPLLAGALRQVAEQDPKNRELMASQENALQQLVLMALNDNPIVVEQTCATLRLLAEHSPALAEQVVDNDVESVMDLLNADEESVQLSALHVLAAAAYQSPVAAVKVLSDKVLRALEGLVLGPDTPWQLRAAALETVGNLAFAPKNRTRLQGRVALMQRVLQLAQQEGPDTAGGGAGRIKAAAMRVLAVLGENDAVWRAVQRRPLLSERGVRILSMDGGGMKGIATVRLLRELEARTGRRIHEMFDLICGTSTGGLLAVALGLRKLSLDECDHIYKVLGQKVFSRPLAKQDKEETWMESFYRTFHSKTQHVRAVVVGYKHDAAVYETLLKDYCDFSKERACLSDSMIDTACLDVPKVALVSTLASMSPAMPFIFRNYEIPPASEALARQIRAHTGSSKHKVWQAVRASSAATYYLDDFSCGGDKFQDGAVTANNPAIIALQEARLLWPDAPISLMVSLGSGSTPSSRRGGSVSSFVETGSILIESACGVERPDEALATLLPLVPGVKYFRFTPLDQRCAMELDEIDPARWAQLEAATEDYIAASQHCLDAAAAALTEGLGAVQRPAAPSPPTPAEALGALRLGASRRLTLLTSPSPGPATQAPQQSGTELCQALVPLCTTVVDVQRQESRARGRLARGRSLGSPGQTLSSSRSSTGAGQSPASGGSQRSLTAAAASGEAAASGADRPTSTDVAPPSPQASTTTVADGSEEGRGDGGGLASILSWFSPRKQQQPLPPPVRLADASAAPAARSAGSNELHHPSFVSISFGQRAAGAAGAAASGGEPASREGPAGTGTAAATATADSAGSAPVATQTQSPEAEGSAACSSPPATPGAAGAEPGALGPAEFLAQELHSCQEGGEAVEVGACHLGLAAAGGDGLVLSWRQGVEAVLEPSEAAAAMLSRLGLGGSADTLSQLFERRPAFPLPLPSSSSSSSEGSIQGLHGPGALALLSQQQQWVGGQQLHVLLLQSTLPDQLLTSTLLEEGGLHGAFSQQVVVCPSSIAPRLLLALLGGGGAAAVVCPRGSSQAGEAGGNQRSAEAASKPAAGRRGEEAFWLAFYSALQRGATLAAALGEAEGAHPALAGVYGVHGICDGVLVTLP